MSVSLSVCGCNLLVFPLVLLCAEPQPGDQWVGHLPLYAALTFEWTHRRSQAADAPTPSHRNRSWWRSSMLPATTLWWCLHCHHHDCIYLHTHLTKLGNRNSTLQVQFSDHFSVQNSKARFLHCLTLTLRLSSLTPWKKKRKEKTHQN